MVEKSGAKIKLGMMRHLFIVMDMSECMKQQVSTVARLEKWRHIPIKANIADPNK